MSNYSNDYESGEEVLLWLQAHGDAQIIESAAAFSSGDDVFDWLFEVTSEQSTEAVDAEQDEGLVEMLESAASSLEQLVEQVKRPANDFESSDFEDIDFQSIYVEGLGEEGLFEDSEFAERFSEQEDLALSESDEGVLLAQSIGEKIAQAGYKTAFHMLNGLSMPKLLDGLTIWNTQNGMKRLRDNFDQSAGLDQPRLTLAMDAVELKAKSGGATSDDLRQVRDRMATMTLPMDQQLDVLNYLGFPQSRLDTSRATLITTSKGNFYKFASPPHHTNTNRRPKFQHPASVMVTYAGAGNDGRQTIHTSVATALDLMMWAMRAEGERINDESLKRAIVASAFRPPELSEGIAYLSALKKTIREAKDKQSKELIFAGLEFPSSLENTAKSDLGFTGSARHREFVNQLAAQPGWSQEMAQKLVSITGNYKAPRGGSTHHSGVVADINFPYAVSSSAVESHDMDRNRNARALQSAAGVWLATNAPKFGFDTYDTSKEIWHQEWLNWGGTTADPAYKAP